MSPAPYPLFVKRDLDGFFGLFIDNVVQLLAIVGLCGAVCGMTGDDARFLFAHILPGAAVSILFGNVFYAWQAHRLARRTGRSDVTALPYGINTPSMIVYVMFVMAPAYQRTGSAQIAWQMGLVACLGSGLIELCGAAVAGWIRSHTPRAALLSTLSGIAVGFISMTFALQIFHKPLIAMLPLALVLLTLFSSTRFPWGVPGGLLAVLAGTISAWLLTGLTNTVDGLPSWISRQAMDPAAVRASLEAANVSWPQWAGEEIVAILNAARADAVALVSVIIPMGLFNLVGSLQNIESAEAAGDTYDTRSSLAVNGLGTMLAAGFGSCFPTTIYIGHPGWKGLGARAGYSTLNGLVITALCLGGVVGILNSIVPIEAGVAILLWIGVIITAQSFQSTPDAHAPAVAMGLFPAIAAWGATVTLGAFQAAGGQTVEQTLAANPAVEVNGFLLHGMIVMERGYIFTCMTLAAVSAFLIDRRFVPAMLWSLVAAAFTAVGLMHAYHVQGNALDYQLRFTESQGGITFSADGIAIGYLLFAAVFGAVAWREARAASHDSPTTDDQNAA